MEGEEEVAAVPSEPTPVRNEEVLEQVRRQLLEQVPPRAAVPAENVAPEGGGGGVPGALGSSAGITGPLGQRRVLYTEVPEYPLWARREGVEASVRYRFWVAPSGEVIRVETLRRSAYPDLEALGREALLRWRFAPLPPGRYEDQWGEVSIVWRLDTEQGEQVVLEKGS
jgi:protein TonB